MSSGSARLAVVTGASSGIGAAVVNRLAAEGWSVDALGRAPDRLAALADATSTHPGRVRTTTLDLLDEAAIERWASAHRAEQPELHALVHCAGVVHRGAFVDTSVADLDEQFAVNLRAPWTLTSALLPSLQAARGYAIFVNSSQGLSAGADAVGYAASKHAMKALADGLRAEVNDTGVRVCSVYPGRTATPGQRKILSYEGRDYLPDRLLEVDDVAKMIGSVLNLSSAAEVTDLTLRPARKLGGAGAG